MESKRATAPKEAMDIQQAMEETLGKANTKFSHLKMNSENPISPVKTKTKNVKERVFAENYTDRVHFNMHLFHKEADFKGVVKTHHFNANIAPNSNPGGLYPQLKGISATRRTGSASKSQKGSQKGGSKAASVRSQKVSPNESDDEDNEDNLTIS